MTERKAKATADSRGMAERKARATADPSGLQNGFTRVYGCIFLA
jgi:hypothetical protein